MCQVINFVISFIMFRQFVFILFQRLVAAKECKFIMLAFLAEWLLADFFYIFPYLCLVWPYLMCVGLFQRQLFGSSACPGDDAWWQQRGLGAHGWGRPLQCVCQEALHPPRPWWLKIRIYNLRQENIRSDSKWPMPTEYFST